MIFKIILYNLIMAGVDVAALVCLYRKRTAAVWCAVLIGLGLLVLSLAAAIASGRFATVHLVAYGLFLHGSVVLAGSAVLLRKALKTAAVLSAVAVAGLLLVAVDAFLIEPTWLEISYVRLKSPKLDRPLRIVVLADFQTDRLGPYERMVLRRVLQEEPDLILLAGDYLDVCRDDWEDLRRRTNDYLKEIDFRAPEGVFAVKGNIDAWYPWPRLFDGLPITTVCSTRSFQVAGMQLTCLSERDSFDTSLALRSPGTDRFHLVLGHAPNFAMGRVEADLLVAGHTHGGQVRLPLVGALTSGCLVPRSWAAGVIDLPGQRKLLVSRGTGMERGDAPRLRFLCRPELVVIELLPE